MVQGLVLQDSLVNYVLGSCNVSAKMEHAGIALGTTVGLSVPILPRLLHKHLLLRVTRPGQPCFLIRSRTATVQVGYPDAGGLRNFTSMNISLANVLLYNSGKKHHRESSKKHLSSPVYMLSRVCSITGC